NVTYPTSGVHNIWGYDKVSCTPKQQGYTYAANECYYPPDGSNCTGNGENINYVSNGYYYTVDFTAAATADLQVFDPAMVNVGSLCSDTSTIQLGTASNLTNIPYYPQGATNTADIHKRFQPVTNTGAPTDPGYEYCTGDQTFP